MKLWAAPVAFLLLSAPAFACPEADSDRALKGAGKAHSVSLETTPDPVRVGEPFSVKVSICDASGSGFTGNVKANASMPRHKHGMNYRPSMRSKANGVFRFDGFLFHMPGLWQFRIDLRNDSVRDSILINYKLDP